MDGPLMVKMLAATGLVIGLAALAAVAYVVRAAEPGPNRDALSKLIKDANFKDAYEGYRKLALDKQNTGKLVGGDMRTAVECLNHLGRTAEIDAFVDAVLAAHPGDWRVKAAAAETLLNVPHMGFIVSGEFHRGGHRGGGRFVNSEDRDRARALQLLAEALPAAVKDDLKVDVGHFHLGLATALMYDAQGRSGWRLQGLTDLKTLPDYAEGYQPFGSQPQGAPVGPDGEPIFHHTPRTFEAAKSDGERWRWALEQAAEADPARRNDALMMRARFLRSQFGVETLNQYLGYRGGAADAPVNAETLRSLKDDETIARLASGVKRFKLPAEFNPIVLFRSVADEPKTGHGEAALNELASMYEARKQFDRAVELWKESAKQYGDQGYKKDRIDQIVGNWGEFGVSQPQPAGRGATLDFNFRNARHVDFEASEIAVDLLLNDTIAYLKSNPAQLDWNKLQVGQVGYRLVVNNETRYLGRKIAGWGLDLNPADGHMDATAAVTTPLQKAGAYLVTAKVEGGNTTRIIAWVDDTVLLKKPMAEKSFFYVGDARTGAPVPRAKVRLFGYFQEQIGNTPRFRVVTKDVDATTDADGQALVPVSVDDQRYQWLIVARGEGGRLARLGFTNVWRAGYYDAQYSADRSIVLTDRPVYRPGQTAKFKAWVGHAQYDQGDDSLLADRAFNIVISDPRGEKLLEKEFRTDRFGGFEGSIELPSNAGLGVYQIVIANIGGGNFRVEEYKKPEYEVKVDGPDEPILLGETVKARIKANYYFGAPVVQATVKYKVVRSEAGGGWYPPGPWDWLYGPGYWWFSPDYRWYPGWSRWGSARPVGWWGRSTPQPEVVAEAEVPIGPDGSVEVTIDTRRAKADHGDQDHRYQITAEVVDQSRRTIVGEGAVLAGRKPFEVTAWVDRGYYKVGDTVHAQVAARTLDGKSVSGSGTLSLMKIAYDEQGKPAETAVRTWDLALKGDTPVAQDIAASEAGQYRLSAKVKDAKGHEVEGGYLFVVTGPGFDGRDFRFNDLELVADKKEYRPGDSVRLMVNANRAQSTVLLFARPSNGVYLPPKTLRLKGKSTVEAIEIGKKDMPNQFFEAITVSDGRVHTELREVVVPPESRVLGMEVQPSKTTVRPGEKGTIRVKLSDAAGKPFVGSTTLAVYDKSVEAIAGGSNVPDIRTTFWSWRRSHTPQTLSSLDESFSPVHKPNERTMQPLFASWGVWISDGTSHTYFAEFDNALTMRFGRQAAGRGGASMRGMMGGMGGMGGAMAPEGLTRAKAEPNLAVAAVDSRIEAMLSSDESPGKPVSGPGAGGGPVEPTVRKNFADTALWVGALTTNADGSAEVPVEFPESLTTWSVRGWAMGPGTRVGEAKAEVVARKDLLVRLQAPRFFVEKDEVVLSAIVHSTLREKKATQVLLELAGDCLKPLEESSRTIELAANSEARVDWRVKAVREGQAIVRMKAITDEESDAVEMSFPVYVHGMLKTDSWSGAIAREDKSADIRIAVPEARRPEQTRLEVRYSPTLAGAMVDALPYMIEYPYGCTEQTLNRFLPAVITQKTLQRMGVDLKAVRDKRANLNAQEIGDPAKRAALRPPHEQHNPVFDTDELNAIVRESVRRLSDMQLSDGGWGWFSGYGEHSSAHTTAVVVRGLQIARLNDVDIPAEVLDRGIAWLKNHQAEQVRLLQNWGKKDVHSKKQVDELDALVFEVLTSAGQKDPAMLGFLERDRPALSVYGKALLGLALAQLGEREKLAGVMRNIEQFVVNDDENQTVHLRLPNESSWWYWYGSETETTAIYLKLLARVEPKGRTASRLAKYVVNNRKHGSFWESTRDTALCVEALGDFLKASGEALPDMTVQIVVDGDVRKEVRITSAELFTYDDRLVIEGAALASGEHTVELRRTGTGPVYFNAYLTNFTLEDPIKRAGLEIKVDRKIYKLIREDREVGVAGQRGQVVRQQVERYRREPLADGATLESGTLVEVELTIDSKNDYEYLVFEDQKAAGFEPVEVRSGYNGNDMGAYVEFRDERTAFFVRSLARGKHSVAYRLRAEVPGSFSALPAKGAAMYAPELRANSDEAKLGVVDRTAREP